MSLEEINKVPDPFEEIKIKCRGGGIVYVPYYVAVQYDFLKSYLENWRKFSIDKTNPSDEKLLELKLYSSYEVQKEFDEKANTIPISEYLGYNGNVNKKYTYEDLLDFENHCFKKEILNNIHIDFIRTGYTKQDGTERDTYSSATIRINGKIVHCWYLESFDKFFSRLHGVEFRMHDWSRQKYEFSPANVKTVNDYIKKDDWCSIIRLLLFENHDFLLLFFPIKN